MLDVGSSERDPSRNRITGKVRQNVFQGDSIMTYVMIQDTHEIGVRSQHRSDETLPEPGSNVNLSWLVQDTIVLPEEDRT